MRLSLRQLEIFVAVAEHGTTTAAGGAIALSQSAVSGALAELEAELDHRLFDRVGKRLVINDGGRALLPQARAVLDAARGIEARFGVGGADPARLPVRLKLAASTTIGNYLLPRLVATFCADRPDARVDVMIGNTREAVAATARLEADFALIEGPCHEDELAVRPWIEDTLVVVCAPDHPLARRRGIVTLAALREASWLLREPGSGTRESVEQVLVPRLHQLRSPIRFGDTEAIKQAAAEGLGVTCLSRHVVADLVALGRLVELRTTLKRLRRRFWLVAHRQKAFTPVVEAFVKHCYGD